MRGKLVERHAELLLDGDLSPTRDDKRRLGTGLTQALETLEAQRCTAGARNANDNATGTDRRLRHDNSLLSYSVGLLTRKRAPRPTYLYRSP